MPEISGSLVQLKLKPVYFCSRQDYSATAVRKIYRLTYNTLTQKQAPIVQEALGKEVDAMNTATANLTAATGMTHAASENLLCKALMPLISCARLFPDDEQQLEIRELQHWSEARRTPLTTIPPTLSNLVGMHLEVMTPEDLVGMHCYEHPRGALQSVLDTAERHYHNSVRDYKIRVEAVSTGMMSPVSLQLHANLELLTIQYLAAYIPMLKALLILCRQNLQALDCIVRQCCREYEHDYPCAVQSWQWQLGTIGTVTIT